MSFYRKICIAWSNRQKNLVRLTSTKDQSWFYIFYNPACKFVSLCTYIQSRNSEKRKCGLRSDSAYIKPSGSPAFLRLQRTSPPHFGAHQIRHRTHRRSKSLWLPYLPFHHFWDGLVLHVYEVLKLSSFSLEVHFLGDRRVFKYSPLNMFATLPPV